MRLSVFTSLLVSQLLCAMAFAQRGSSLSIDRQLVWAPSPMALYTPGGVEIERWSFQNCDYLESALTLPVFTERLPIDGPADATAELVSAVYESFSKKPHTDDATIQSELMVRARVVQERSKFFVELTVLPIRRSGSGFERATSFSVAVRLNPVVQQGTTAADRGGPITYTSVLSTGTAYKFGVSGNGIYKLDYNYLKNELGISNIDQLDPRQIRLYGNGGAMLPENAGANRPDDLIENTIWISGEQDGKFDQSDYILFFAHGPSPWTYRSSASDPQLTVSTNLYDKYSWYFLKTGDGVGLRIVEQPDLSGTTFTTTEFDDVQRLEKEEINLLDKFTGAQGSGKRWFGDYFFQTREQTYSFNFPNLVSGSTGRIRAEFAGRSGTSSVVRMNVPGATFSRNIFSVAVSNNEAPYAANAVLGGAFQPTADNINVVIQYPEVSQASEGWLDYIELNVRRRLVMTGNALEFRDLQTLAHTASRFELSNVSGSLRIWDVTEPLRPRQQGFSLNGSVASFGATTLDSLRNFIAFVENAAFPKPETKVGVIAQQNLHGLENLHLAIIYPKEFESAASQLAEHRRNFGGLDVALVNIDQLFNEFASGGKDPSAIRDFARMLYDRNPDKFEYMLLFGDGSFDPKNNTNSTDNLDFIPVYETAESFDPIRAYPSDDYFALLSDGEGSNIGIGSLDIAVGRLTVRNTSEAQAVVDKIIAYENNPATLGDWRLRNTFIGDDEDGNLHINQADKLAIEAGSQLPFLNLEKIYFDAYQQVATSGGARFPDVESALNADVFRGTLVMQYIGHGGPRGWAQERVLDNNDIAAWDNPNRYPLIITATCSFGGYDDYKTLTGGEQALLRQNAGAVALFTTVRAVFISGNNRLTDAVQDVIYAKLPNGRFRTIGEILRGAKNTLTSDTENARRFTLLGDPAMYLGMPEYRVATTRINGQDVNDGKPDTLRALQPVTIEGQVTDENGNFLPDFNGKVYVTLFDKAQNLSTLGQQTGSLAKTFSVQRNILFRGSASVTNGVFSVSFVVPKDINYAFGQGKISYYAENGTPLDAAGADFSVVIGGNSNIVVDQERPVIEVFLNDENFVLGGITNNSPKILAKCADNYGMNVTGTSLGHDLTVEIDGNVQNLIILNSFYESELNDARRGKAIYPLRDLTEGKHTVRVKGWDIANNPGEGYTEFVVAQSGKAALDHVLNYPNPFTTNTYFQFEHNLASQQLDVQISVFSVAGRLVKTLIHSAPAEGFRVSDIQWNGLDDYGDALARGVYLYRVKVRGTDLSGKQVTAESDFEKLVILK